MTSNLLLPAALLALAFGVIAQAAPADAQTARPAGGGADALSTGWAAYEAGRHGDALASAEQALEAYPHNHGAWVLKLKALAAGGNALRAVQEYEGWARQARDGGRHLLAVVAEEVLRQLAGAAPVLDQRLAALETLALAGDRDAAARLAAVGAEAGIRSLVAKARLGDDASRRSLITAAQTQSGSRRASALEALATIGSAESAAVIRSALEDRDPVVRATAARALARVAGEAAAGVLVPLLQDPMPGVKHGAALALARLGHSEGAELVEAMINSGIPDLVLAVAEALPDQVGRWQGAVEAALDAPNPVDRLRAARALGAVAPDRSRVVFDAALRDDNPVVREVAVRHLDTAQTPVAVEDLGRLLGDPDPRVRLAAARQLLGEILGTGIQSDAWTADTN